MRGAPQAAPAPPWPSPDPPSSQSDAAAPRGLAEALPAAVVPPRPLVSLRQLIACGLLLLLSARLPSRVAALALAVLPPDGQAPHPAGGALAMLGLDGFGVLCAIYLSHARMRGVSLLRCYPPQRLIPLALHFLGLLWGLLTLAQPEGSGW